jgi:hypothetical protein
MQYSPVSINEDQCVIDESINLLKILEKKSWQSKKQFSHV